MVRRIMVICSAVEKLKRTDWEVKNILAGATGHDRVENAKNQKM